MAASSRHAPGADRDWDPVVPPSPSTIDLHTHTRRSDGVLEPRDLVEQAAAAGVRLLAITDHDSLAAYRELSATTLPDGLELIPGVEINAVGGGSEGWWEGELHVLGFGMDPGNEAFEAALAGQRAQRRIRFERMRARLRELGMPVDDALEAVAIGEDDALGRPTVARALMAKGYAASVEDAFRRLLGHGMPAWVPRDGLGPRAAIEAITRAGGVASLAHFAEAPDRVSTLRQLMTHGLRGLEVHYRSWDRRRVDAIGAIADALGLLRTGGSDYHGDLGPYVESHAMLWVPPEAGSALRQAIGRRSEARLT